MPSLKMKETCAHIPMPHKDCSS